MRQPVALNELHIDADIRLTGDLAERLVAHAIRLRKEPVALLADIIETVLQDDLVDAVIDTPVPQPATTGEG